MEEQKRKKWSNSCTRELTKQDYMYGSGCTVSLPFDKAIECLTRAAGKRDNEVR